MTLNVEWLLVPDGLVWVFQKLLIYWDFHAQPSPGFTKNGPEKRKYPVSSSCVDGNAFCQRRMGRLVRDVRKATVTQITTCYNQVMQNTISVRTTGRTLKQMGYSSRRPHWLPAPVSQEQETETTIHTGSPKLDKRRLEKRCLVGWVSISAATFRW